MKISIWQFDEAPKKYRDMSSHNDNEDWVLVLHNCLEGQDINIRPPLFWLFYSDTQHIGYPLDHYVTEWGRVQRIRDGDDLVAITHR